MFSTKTAQFAWKNLQVVVEGRPVTGITNVEYGSEKNIEPIYGAGDSPQFLGEGNVNFPGNIEVLQNEYEALVEEAKRRGLRSITDLEVSIVIAYIPSEANNLPKTIVDRLVGVKFTSDTKTFAQGATHGVMSLPFLALNIKHQE